MAAKENIGNAESTPLGTALSNEFPHWYIAAAAFNKRANELIAEGEMTSEFGIVAADNELPTKLVTTVLKIRDDTFSIHGLDAKLLVCRPVESSAVPVGASVPRSRWLRKIVTPPEPLTVDRLVGEPFLALVVGEQTLFKLVGFDRRAGEDCSYAQLGEEMDNKPVTITEEEQDSRHRLIEAFRGVLDTKSFSVTKREYSEDDIEEIQAFIDKQAELNSEMLADSFDRQLAQRCIEVMGRETVEFDLTITDSNTEPIRETYDSYIVTSDYFLGDGRVVSLVLATPTHHRRAGVPDIGLYAVTRGGVSVLLGSVSNNYGGFELTNPDILDDYKDEAIRSLLYMIVSPPSHEAIIEATTRYRDINPDKMTNQEKMIAEHFVKMGLFQDAELVYTDVNNYVWRDDTKVDHETARLLELFFAHPDDSVPPFSTKLMSIALDRLAFIQNKSMDLFSSLAVEERLQAVLGEARKCDELLIHYVRLLSEYPRGAKVLLPNFTIDRTIDHVLVETFAVRDNYKYELRITAKPEAGRNEPMKTIMHLTLDPTKPFLGHEGDIEGSFNSESIEELVEAISKAMISSRVEQLNLHTNM